jgi:hypothetical protein
MVRRRFARSSEQGVRRGRRGSSPVPVVSRLDQRAPFGIDYPWGASSMNLEPRYAPGSDSTKRDED